MKVVRPPSDQETDPHRAEFEGILNLRDIDEEVRCSLVSKLAERGSILAMIFMGDRLAMQREDHLDLRPAKEWYERAAEKGSLLARNNLGIITKLCGDIPLAIQTFEKVARLNYAPAMYNLGLAYAYGELVPKDLNRSRDLLNSAAELGYLSAERELRMLELRGVFGIAARFRALPRIWPLMSKLAAAKARGAWPEKTGDW